MLKLKAKYLLCPGYIIGQFSREMFYISAANLAKLYGVDWDECVIAPPPWATASEHAKVAHLIRLVPKQSGQYKLPEAPIDVD